MRKAYTRSQMAEAIALADVLGSEGAADQLGMDVRTVRKWRAAAGYRPDLDPPKDQLQALYDLALSKVTEQVATGKIKGTQLMTVVGIAADKIAKASARKAEPVDPKTVDQAALDELEAYADGIRPGLFDEAMKALGHEVAAELARRATSSDDDLAYRVRGDTRPPALAPEASTEPALPAILRELIDRIATGTYVPSPEPARAVPVIPDLDDLLARADRWLEAHP